MNTIWTPFYKNSNYLNIECPPEIQSNYSNYNNYLLFSFKNWIHPWINENIGTGIIIEYNELPKDKKVYTVLQLKDQDKPVSISDDLFYELRELVESFSIQRLSWIPVFYFNQTIYNGKTRLPTPWINNMLKYITINNGYSMKIENIGLVVNLEDVSNYTEVQAELSLIITEQLISMYNIGFLIQPSDSLIKNWKLKPYLINESELDTATDLYYTDWYNVSIVKIYGSMTDFLITREEDQNTVYLEFPNDINGRYNLSVKIVDYNYLYSDNTLEINVDNLDQLLKILQFIEESKNNYGSKDTDDTDDAEDSEEVLNEYEILYLEKVEYSSQLNGGIIYRTDDVERPYTYIKPISKK